MTKAPVPVVSSASDDDGCSEARCATSSETMGLGRLTEPAVAQDHPGTLQLCLDANPFDVAFEADGVAFQIVFDLEHLADLHEELVVREPVAHLMGGGTMGIGTENRSQPPQVSGKLLDRDTLLVTQFAYGLPVRSGRGAPISPPTEASVPPSDQQVVDNHDQNGDEHHDGDGNTTKYYLVQVHRHEITLSRALWVHKPRPDRDTSCYLRAPGRRRNGSPPKLGPVPYTVPLLPYTETCTWSM
jgi:hypothetical protein